MTSSPWFWVVLYVLNIAAFAAVFRLHEAGLAVPFVVYFAIAATCGLCQTMLERANELRRLRDKVDEERRKLKDPKA